MNSHQRRKERRRTGKIVHMNTVTCPVCDGPARPTFVGYFCPRCQMWGNLHKETLEAIKDMDEEQTMEYIIKHQLKSYPGC